MNIEKYLADPSAHKDVHCSCCREYFSIGYFSGEMHSFKKVRKLVFSRMIERGWRVSDAGEILCPQCARRIFCDVCSGMVKYIKEFNHSGAFANVNMCEDHMRELRTMGYIGR